MGYIPQRSKAKDGTKIDKRTADRKVGGIYVYHLPNGEPYQVNKRIDYYKDGARVGKDVFQFQADGETRISTSWQPVLYNLPAVIEAAKAGRVIIATEGEGKADLLKGIDRGPGMLPLAATTHSGGCKNEKGWLASEPWKYAEGCDYWAQLEDNDEPGYKFATFACYHLHKHGIPVKRIALPGLGLRRANHGLDVADWMPGHTLDELLELIDAAPFWTT